MSLCPLELHILDEIKLNSANLDVHWGRVGHALMQGSDACPCAHAGTRVGDLVGDLATHQGKNPVKGFATIDFVSIICVEVRQ